MNLKDLLAQQEVLAIVQDMHVKAEDLGIDGRIIFSTPIFTLDTFSGKRMARVKISLSNREQPRPPGYEDELVSWSEAEFEA